MSPTEAATGPKDRAGGGLRIGLLVVIALVAAAGAACIGRFEIDMGTLLRVLASRIFPIEHIWPDTVETVLFEVRLPRVAISMLIGAALSGSGVTFQGIFRNPLVSPFILGVSGGAGFGAAVAILLDGGSLAIQLSAFGFGAFAVLMAVLLSRAYRCPQGQLLAYATTDRNGYRHYKSDPDICRDCPLRASCTSNAKAERTITRHVWADARERTDAHRLTPWGDLQTQERDRRTLLRRRQATPRPSLRAFPKSGESPRPVPARRHSAKHQENCNGAHKGTQTGHRMRAQASACRLKRHATRKTKIAKQNPPKLSTGLSAV